MRDAFELDGWYIAGVVPKFKKQCNILESKDIEIVREGSADEPCNIMLQRNIAASNVLLHN